MPNTLTYKDAGVDQNKKDAVIDRIISMMRRTYDGRVVDVPWGYAGFFSLSHPGALFGKKYRDPVLVSCTDGVGTKMMNKHDTVGVDLVAMSVNDMAVCGAEPLFFLDYVAVGKVEGTVVEQLVKGIVDGCQQSQCALLGGETAEMPGFYKAGEYDMAGFAVGIVERNRIIDGKTVNIDDDIIGLSSSGIHSNGYSLVRKVFFDKKKLGVHEHVERLGCTLGEELLKPTRIYVQAVKEVLSHYRVKKAVKAIAHITGGGMIENIPRVLPGNTAAEIDEGRWPVPPVFGLIEEYGNVPRTEMYRVFNMGIGLVIVVDPFFSKAIVRRLSKMGQDAFVIGKIRKGGREVKIRVSNA
jgi:phosphoribosylformylglycinamidine cyclo-ligase